MNESIVWVGGSCIILTPVIIIMIYAIILFLLLQFSGCLFKNYVYKNEKRSLKINWSEYYEMEIIEERVYNQLKMAKKNSKKKQRLMKTERIPE